MRADTADGQPVARSFRPSPSARGLGRFRRLPTLSRVRCGGVLLAALVLLGGPVGASLARTGAAGGGSTGPAGPALIRPRHTPAPARVPFDYRFDGDVDLWSADGVLVGHLVAHVGAPVDGGVMPGTLTVHWTTAARPADLPVADPGAPQVMESHALLAVAWSARELRPQPEGATLVVGATGEICDYASPGVLAGPSQHGPAPAGFACRAFAVEFSASADPAHPHRVAWQFERDAASSDYGLRVGAGAFDLEPWARDGPHLI